MQLCWPFFVQTPGRMMQLTLQRLTALQMGLDSARVTHPGDHFLKLFSLRWWEYTVLTTFLLAFMRDFFLRCLKSAWPGLFPCRVRCWEPSPTATGMCWTGLCLLSILQPFGHRAECLHGCCSQTTARFRNRQARSLAATSGDAQGSTGFSAPGTLSSWVKVRV